MVMQREFVMIKPDGVQRGLVGEVIKRFENSGLKIIAMKFMKVTMEQAQEHYKEHEGKSFYEGLLKYITSGPVVSMVVEGDEAIKKTREVIVGKTNPLDAAPGSIRGDFGLQIGRNIVHASDKPESAEREIKIYFNEDELLEWDWVLSQWIYEQ